MKIALIGAGRLSVNLGRALHDAGHDILQVFSRTEKPAATLAAAVGASPLTDIENLTKSADIYIVAVTDSALADLIPKACKGREQKIFLHTAGSIPADAFKGMALHYGVLYPLQTFSKERSVDFGNIPCLIEANDEYTLGTTWDLASSISQDVRAVNSEQRKFVHLAAVFACNFVNHCYALAADIMEQKGLPFELLLPLIDETASKVHTLPPATAQTGPALRYDENVIRSQIKLLAGNPFAKDLYDRMTLSIHRKFETR